MRSLLIMMFGVIACAPSRGEITIRDDSGAEVRLERPARRIVSLAPHITEILFAAGAGDRVVGAVDYSNYPEAANRIARVGSYTHLDLESILALKPDLAIGWPSGNAPADLEAFKRLGVPLFLSQPDRVDDIAANIERLGELAGTAASARQAGNAFRTRLADLRGRYSGRPTVRTFYQISSEPLMTIGGNQIIGSVIQLCGGVNVFAGLAQMAPAVSFEAVLAADPEVIVASGMDEVRPAWLDQWRRWPQITAVSRDNLFSIPPDLIQRHTPRLLDGADRLCRDLETARHRRPIPR